MSHKVVFTKEADAHLRQIARYIAAKRSARIAEAYLTRIILACHDLRTLPHRGTQQDHLLPGLRTIGFETRVTIAFRVREQTVAILAVLYGGQSLEKYFARNTFPPS